MVAAQVALGTVFLAEVSLGKRPVQLESLNLYVPFF